MQAAGEDEEESAAKWTPALRHGSHFKHTKGIAKDKASGGRGPRDELKNADQIRKERKKKENLLEKNLPKAARRAKMAKEKAAGQVMALKGGKKNR